MNQKVSHRQKFFQRMALTPQMRHSIQLLGMSTKDLNEYIDSVVEANPFLKKSFDEKRAEKYKTSSSTAAPYERNDNMNAQDEDARLSLLSQLRMLNMKDKALEIAEHLIYEMDDNGYITVMVEEVAKDIFASIEEVENCLSVIQSLDPPGIGARDIRECLQLQLKRMHKEDSLEHIIVSEFIGELAKEDIARISKVLDVDKEKIRAAVTNIKKLNPRPASTMLSKSAKRIVPDLVATVKDEKVRLELNRDWLPHLKIYNPYEDKLDIIKDPEAKKFMKENMDAARGLVDGLKRREETMCKVADYILNFHREEIVRDIDGIKSLTTKEVSLALNLHLTTINRTVLNKYIEINDKVMPLRGFLCQGLKKENGEVISKIAVKKKIEALVRAEDKTRPLSDKAIQEKLRLEGITIERRTIAKYRNALRILPTYLRKKAA